MRNVGNSVCFLGAVLCLAIAGAALHEVGRRWDALEAHRVKRGCGTQLGNPVPEGAVLEV